MKKHRADLLLVERGLAGSCQKAQALILAGAVSHGGRPVEKPAELLAADLSLEIASPSRYVGRGGEKLAHALRHFRLDVSGLVALDVGASTGGFTDCLLQHGARRVYAVDVGYGQFDYRLRQDPRVVVMERTNIRYLEGLPERVDLATIDVSFIGLEKVLPAVACLLKGTGRIIALLKPQFQAQRYEVGKGGVIRDRQMHARVLGRFIGWAAVQGFHLEGLTLSPLRGPRGNLEFFLLLTVPPQPALAHDEQGRQ